MSRRELSRRKLLKGSAALALGGVFAAPLRAAAPPPQAITPELIDAAKKEGKIVFYSSMDLPVGEKLGKAFEALSRHLRADRTRRRGAPVPADRPGVRLQHPRRRYRQQRRRLALHPLEEERLADAVRAGRSRQVFSGSVSRRRRNVGDHPRLAVVDRLQHRSGEGRRRAKELCRPAGPEMGG